MHSLVMQSDCNSYLVPCEILIQQWQGSKEEDAKTSEPRTAYPELGERKCQDAGNTWDDLGGRYQGLLESYSDRTKVL